MGDVTILALYLQKKQVEIKEVKLKKTEEEGEKTKKGD